MTETTYDRYPYGSIRHADEGSLALAMRSETATERADERDFALLSRMYEYDVFLPAEMPEAHR